MEHEIDLTMADQDVLIGIIVRQQAIIERLEKRIAQLEGRGKSGSSGRMPGLNPKGERKPAQPKKPRQSRRHGFARSRMTPDRRVEHALEQCPDCGTQLSGGWTQRTREVIELPQVPVQVTEHAYIARTCAQCHRYCVPSAQLDGVVLDQRRLGINLVSLIAALREEARLPWRTIQWYLARCTGCTSAWELSWMQPNEWPKRPRLNWRPLWNGSEAVRWSMPMRPVGGKTDTTATCGPSAHPTSGTS